MLLHWNVRSSWRSRFPPVFLPFLAREARQNGHWEIRSGVYKRDENTFQRRNISRKPSSILVDNYCEINANRRAFIDDINGRRSINRHPWSENCLPACIIAVLFRWRVALCRENIKQQKGNARTAGYKLRRENRIFPFLSRLPRRDAYLSRDWRLRDAEALIKTGNISRR